MDYSEFLEEDDHFYDHCGVFGVFGSKEAANLCYFGLYSLQHRGQESAGIVSRDKRQYFVVKDMGLVSEIFEHEQLHYLKGDSAIGHVRYSTTGSSETRNIQPLYSKTAKGKIAIAHNGNLTNAYKLYNKLKNEGALFQSTVDSEVIMHLFSRSKKKKVADAMLDTLSKIEGAYSLVMLGDDCMMAARDPQGFRPLVLAKRKDAYIVSSETCALDLINAEYIREIEPGELVYIDKDGVKSFKIPLPVKPALCVFEHVYFARPDSLIFGENAHLVRREFGRMLAREHGVDADMVMAIPDSGNSAALGYAEESGIPYEIGMTRNHYVGRTFIQPKQKIRNLKVKVKLNPIREVLKGKRVVVIDDSIVRGTTSRQRVQSIRNAGAKEIHVRISSPPITNSCHFGIDTPDTADLIAANKSIEEIRKYIGADSLAYLSKEKMLESFQTIAPEDFCTGCFDGKYPIKLHRKKGKYAFEKEKISYYGKA
ncbi:MAG: amidophosphoribosyltransferase [bacterium]|nr:amidophosphoribosyltransferase [bacterium]